jgi:hypothetical protein
MILENTEQCRSNSSSDKRQIQKALTQLPNVFLGHWNVTRHIDRWHAGLGKPVADDIRQYKGDMTLHFSIGPSCLGNLINANLFRVTNT